MCLVGFPLGFPLGRGGCVVVEAGGRAAGRVVRVAGGVVRRLRPVVDLPGEAGMGSGVRVGA
jgi:hypothetical protein